MALLLSGDINLNSGLVARPELFNNTGLHLIHLNVNSLLPKIDKLCNAAKCSNAAVIGITEAKLDNTCLRL